MWRHIWFFIVLRYLWCNLIKSESSQDATRPDLWEFISIIQTHLESGKRSKTPSG